MNLDARLVLRLTSQMRRELERIASVDQRSMGSLIRLALSQYIEAKGNPRPKRGRRNA